MSKTAGDIDYEKHNFLSFFALLPLTIHPKNLNWEKCRKSGDIIILLHTCNTNEEDYMMYGF